MPDPDWLRNLARARFVSGQWQSDDEGEIQTLAQARIEECIHFLFEEARESAEIFNAHARGNKAIRLLPIRPKSGETGGGLMLLLGTTELDIEYIPHRLEANLKTMKGFQRRTRRLHVFKPHVDPFGSVLWQADKTLLLTPEVIMKTLLEQLARAAYESGEIMDSRQEGYLDGREPDSLTDREAP